MGSQARSVMLVQLRRKEQRMLTARIRSVTGLLLVWALVFVRLRRLMRSTALLVKFLPASQNISRRCPQHFRAHLAQPAQRREVSVVFTLSFLTWTFSILSQWRRCVLYHDNWHYRLACMGAGNWFLDWLPSR